VPPPFPFDAVLFDLDGTLVATGRFWPDAARAGALRAFHELGLEREPPTRAQWMGLVGLPLEQGFDQLFADLSPRARRVLQRHCEEAEHELLRDGAAAPLPGVVETLAALRERGARIGIASNCGRGYLEAMMHGLGLERWVEEGRCLDSRGVSCKADMVEDLLATFGTRSAVFVGDRSGDRDAAWANGLPHVHLARGYAAEGERVEAEATIEGMDALCALLERRDAELAQLWRALDVPRGARIAVGGTLASGKSLVARDLARLAQAHGARARVVDIEDYRSGEPRGPADPLADAYDLERLEQEVLAPRASGAADAELLLVDGPYLVHPRLAARFDRLVWCDARETVRLRRILGRDARRAGPEPLMRARSVTLPLERAFRERYPPEATGARVLDLSNPLAPRPGRPDPE